MYKKIDEIHKGRLLLYIYKENYFLSLLRLSLPLLSLELFSLLGFATYPSGLGRIAFLETFSFLVLGSIPKYLTSITSPILTISVTFSVRFQSNSDT